MCDIREREERPGKAREEDRSGRGCSCCVRKSRRGNIERRERVALVVRMIE